MPIPFIGALVAKPALALGAFAAVAVIGFGAGVGWEHRGEVKIPVVGFLLGKSLKVQRDNAQEAARQMELHPKWGRNAWRDAQIRTAAVALQWADAKRQCEVKRRQERDARAADISNASGRTDRASSSAFNNGYAVGKRAGARQCGATPNAPTPANRPDGRGPVPDPVGRNVPDDPGWAGSPYVPGHQ